MLQDAVVAVVLPKELHDSLEGGGTGELGDGLGGKGADARAGVFHRLDDGSEAGGGAGIGECPQNLGADLRVGILQQRDQRIGDVFRGIDLGGPAFPADLSKAPDGVQTGERILGEKSDLLQDRQRLGTPRGQLELGFLPDPHVLVFKIGDETVGGGGLEALAEEAFGFGDDGLFGGLRIGQAEDPALLGPFPAFTPVGEINGAVGSDVDIGDQGVGDEAVVGRERVARAVAVGGDAGNAAAGAGSLEVGEEESAVEFWREAGAGVVDETARAVGDVRDRGQNIGGLAVEVRNPEALHVPGAGIAEGSVLVADPPTGIGTFHDVDPAFAVALVGVVVAGEEVAVFVEGEFLRIAQAVGEGLEIRAVEFTAENAAFIGKHEAAAFLGQDVCSPVSKAEVEPSVGSDDEAVHVMARVAETHAVAPADSFPRDGMSFGVGAFEQGQLGNVGEPDLTLAGQNTGGDAVEFGVELVRVDRAEVGLARTGTVFQQPDNFGFDGEVRPLGSEVFLHHRSAVLDRPAGEIVLQHEHVVPDIEDAGPIAMGFRNEDAAFFVEAEGDRVGQHRFGRPEIELHPGWNLELPGAVLRFRGRGRGLGLRRSRIRLELGVLAGGSGDIGTEKRRGGCHHGAGDKSLFKRVHPVEPRKLGLPRARWIREQMPLDRSLRAKGLIRV